MLKTPRSWPESTSKNNTRLCGRLSFEFTASLDCLTIQNGRSEAADDVRVVGGELESVNQEEAAIARGLAGRRADLGPKDVVCQGGGCCSSSSASEVMTN